MCRSVSPSLPSLPVGTNLDSLPLLLLIISLLFHLRGNIPAFFKYFLISNKKNQNHQI